MFESPLRWYLALLLIGAVASIGVGNPIGKFQIQRLVEVGLALGMLAWCYRPQAASWLGRPIGSGWYGLGLLGFGGWRLLVVHWDRSLGFPWVSLAWFYCNLACCPCLWMAGVSGEMKASGCLPCWQWR